MTDIAVIDPSVSPELRTFADVERVLADTLPSPLLGLTGLSLAEFWSNYQRVGDCLEWQGSRTNSWGMDYGRVWVPSQRKHVRAHRIVHELAYGTTSLHVLHHCDNPPCGRPIHLFTGTDKANHDDCKAKGRHRPPAIRRGLANNKAVLTLEQIDEIRSRYETGETQTALAREFGVHQTSVSLWVRGIVRSQA